MTIPESLKLPGAALAVGSAALLLAACGSSSPSSSTTSSSASTASNAGAYGSNRSSGLSPAATSIAITKGSKGTYLTGAGGRTIYLWVADSKNRSVCSGACAQVWPPVTANGAPSAGSGVKSADLGTITRSDGKKQVTYAGHPLYYYVSDTGAGSVTGQGSDSFGAKWWLVSPGGTAITSG